MKKQIEEMKKDIHTVLLHNCKYDFCKGELIGFNEEGIAKELYDDGYRKQEWISVEERLPENHGNIITYHGNFQEIDAYYYCGNGKWMDGRGDFASSEYYGITHWMPLPEPPKGE